MLVDAGPLPIPNPLFQGTLAQTDQPWQLLRHIILPFDLRTDPDAFYQPENRDILASIFPGNHGLSMDGMFLYFLQKAAPPKPWPRTIAGLPPYFAPEIGPQHTPRPFGFLVQQENDSIAEDQNGRDMEDWEPLFYIIQSHFRALGIGITEVMYWGNYVIIVLEHRDTDVTKLPRKAANIACTYLYDDEIGRPSAPQARRIMDPTFNRARFSRLTPGNPDESEYKTLQPGVRVTSACMTSKPNTFMSTTAGALVSDLAGNEFMTVASHRFPDECGTKVTHPLPVGGRTVGELIMEVTHTGIGLVKLADTERFSNVTFQSESISESTRLKKLSSVKKLQVGDFVYLDSPDTGSLEGSFMGSSFQRIPVDDHSNPQQRIPDDDHSNPQQLWVFTAWVYMGQGSASTLPDSMCGSTIWTSKGEVIAFFRHALKSGVMKDWCVGIAADELMKRGYKLVDGTES
jgi:hypothetical protein